MEVVSAPGHGQGHLSVTARTDGDTTLVTLTASGSSPVHWSARTGAAWLYLSKASGTLDPGASVTIKVYVDHLHEPLGQWRARVSIAPAGAVVTIDGYGNARPSHPGDHGHGHGHGPGPTPSATGSSGPGSTPPASPEPSDSPADPSPTPTPTDASPSDPGGSTPPPSDSGTASPTS